MLYQFWLWHGWAVAPFIHDCFNKISGDTQMKAYVLHKAGGVENLILSDIDKPHPGAGKVVVIV
jgi:hypothetical protein